MGDISLWACDLNILALTIKETIPLFIIFPTHLPSSDKLVQSGFCYLANEAAWWYSAYNPSHLKV